MKCTYFRSEELRKQVTLIPEIVFYLFSPPSCSCQFYKVAAERKLAVQLDGAMEREDIPHAQQLEVMPSQCISL